MGSTHSWRIHFAFSSFMLGATANAQMNVSQGGRCLRHHSGRIQEMTKIAGAARGLVRCAGLAAAAVLVLSAAAVLVLSAAPQQRAEALSLASPGTLPVAKYASEGMTTEVRGGHGGHGGGGFHGGGAAFHGGGFRGGGM